MGLLWDAAQFLAGYLGMLAIGKLALKLLKVGQPTNGKGSN